MEVAVPVAENFHWDQDSNHSVAVAAALAIVAAALAIDHRGSKSHQHSLEGQSLAVVLADLYSDEGFWRSTSWRYELCCLKKW